MTIYVITGPPAGGKTTWVREHAKPGDITIDYDTLAAALSPGLPDDVAQHPEHVCATAQAARTAAINDATTTAHNHDVYITHAMPSRLALSRYRNHGFEITTIDPGYDECMRRARTHRTPRQLAIVDDWYKRRGLA